MKISNIEECQLNTIINFSRTPEDFCFQFLVIFSIVKNPKLLAKHFGCTERAKELKCCQNSTESTSKYEMNEILEKNVELHQTTDLCCTQIENIESDEERKSCKIDDEFEVVYFFQIRLTLLIQDTIYFVFKKESLPHKNDLETHLKLKVLQHTHFFTMCLTMDSMIEFYHAIYNKINSSLWHCETTLNLVGRLKRINVSRFSCYFGQFILRV